MPAIFSSRLPYLCLTLLLLTTACDQKSPEQKHFLPNAQVLKLNLHSDPPSLDSRTATDAHSAAVLRMLFEGLTRILPDGTTEPAAAEQITLSENNTRYTFVLREASWSNGDPVTAHDFAQTWKQVLDPAFPSALAYQLYVLKNGKAANEGKASIDEIGVTAVDEKTLVVDLEQPTPYFLELTAHMMFYPVNQKADKVNPNWSQRAGDSYPCNGPFRLLEWKHSDLIVVGKNPSYWDANSVNIDGMLLSMVEDAATELHMFENGELDWAGPPLSLTLPVDAIPHLRHAGKLVTTPIAGTYYYQFNTKRFPFNNQKLRKAFAYAIGRERITENVTQGEEVPAMGLVPDTMPFEQKPFFADKQTAKAQELFQEALTELGVTKKELPVIQLNYNTGEHHLKVAQAIQEQWNRAFGIQVQLLASEWKVHLNTLQQKNFMIARLGWVADFNDPINFLEVLKYESGGSNHTGWMNPRYTELLNSSAREADPKMRQEILLEAEALLMDELPVAPVYFLTFSYVKSDKLKDVYVSPLGGIDFRWAKLIR